MNQRSSLPPALNGLDLDEHSSREKARSALEQTPKFIEYWRAIMLHKWSIAGLVLLAVALGYAWVARQPPLYRSVATLLIEIDRSKVVPVGEPYTGIGSYYREHFQTQAEVLKSREVAQRVIARLKLAQHPEFASRETERPVVQQWLAEHCGACVRLLSQKSHSESVAGQ